MITQPASSVAIRIRFAGSEEAQTFHMTLAESARLHSDWKAYLGGNGPIGGGEYTSQEGEHTAVISLNFSLIAYMEPGKVY